MRTTSDKVLSLYPSFNDIKDARKLIEKNIRSTLLSVLTFAFLPSVLLDFGHVQTLQHALNPAAGFAASLPDERRTNRDTV
eukprot:g69123.t1